jgi:hypothetical protein
MTEIRATIQFEDEAPKIGSGLRIVNIKIGRKWAYLTDVANGRRQKITLDTLEKLKPMEQINEAAKNNKGI